MVLHGTRLNSRYARPMQTALTTAHRRRLRAMWRSAGWPFQDMLEVELLAAGLLERQRDAAGRETLRVTDTGVAVLAQTLQRNRAARSAHEALVEQVAREMQRAGRIVWRGLSLRAPLADEEGTRWAVAMPDVYSIRHTTVEAYLEPVVHEIKVRRADLLADLRLADKRTAYMAVSSECWYVLSEGIARAEEIPPECGVLIAGDSGLQVARPAPKRALRMGFGLWMALARAAPMDNAGDEDAQAWLRDTAAGAPGAAPP